MIVTVLIVPAPERVPVCIVKVILSQFRPCDVVAAIICREVDTVLLVVGGDDHARAVDAVMLADIFLINAKDIRR